MLFFHAVITLFLLLIMAYDVSKFIIPNWINGTLLLLWPAMFLLTPVRPEWEMHLIALGVAFVVGFVFFALRVMGGGDIKLLVVSALWIGHEHIVEFLIYMGVLGGVLSIALLAVRPLANFWYKQEQLPRLLHKGAPVPYGLAIAGAFLILLWNDQIPGLIAGT
jgi:prepilin peptidase CpaA